MLWFPHVDLSGDGRRQIETLSSPWRRRETLSEIQKRSSAIQTSGSELSDLNRLFSIDVALKRTPLGILRSDGLISSVSLKSANVVEGPSGSLPESGGGESTKRSAEASTIERARTDGGHPDPGHDGLPLPRPCL